jgi:DNA repair protein RecO (recombination protein O)
VFLARVARRVEFFARVKDVATTDALLLRAVDYRDADRIVTLFTRDLGKLSAIARSAKSSRRRFAGALEPYCVIRVELELGNAELARLLRAEVVSVFPGILAELDRMEAAGAALALLRDAHPARVPDAALFLAAVQYLTLLDHEADPARAGLLAFALRALALSGISPRLSACGRSGEPVPPGKPAYFDPALGAVVSRRFGGGPFLLGAGARESMLRAQSEDWVSTARAGWEPDALNTVRGAVAAFIAHHLSRELASRLFPG